MSCSWTDKVGCEELCFIYNPVSFFTDGMGWVFNDDQCGPTGVIGDDYISNTTVDVGNVLYMEIIVYIPNSYPTAIYSELHVLATFGVNGENTQYNEIELQFIERVEGTNYYKYGKAVIVEESTIFNGYHLAYSFAYNNGFGYVHDGSYDYLAGVFIYDMLFGNYLPNTDVWVNGVPTMPGSYLDPVVETGNQHPPAGTNIYVNNITPCSG